MVMAFMPTFCLAGSISISETTITETATTPRSIILPDSDGTVALEAAVNLKADLTEVYTKDQIDQQFYKKQEVDTHYQPWKLALTSWRVVLPN